MNNHGLQKLSREITKTLEGFKFLQHVRGLAGKLEVDKEHYVAQFNFIVEEEHEVRKLKGYLEERQNNYESEIIIEKTPIAGFPGSNYSETWHLLLISFKGKPSDQELSLEKSLGFLLKDLQAYRR